MDKQEVEVVKSWTSKRWKNGSLAEENAERNLRLEQGTNVLIRNHTLQDL